MSTIIVSFDIEINNLAIYFFAITRKEIWATYILNFIKNHDMSVTEYLLILYRITRILET